MILQKSGLPDPFRKSVKDEENVLEIVKFFAKSAKEKRQLPTFVIFEPTEDTACGEEISACVTTKVNDMCRRFEGFMERLNKGDLNLFTRTSFPTQPNAPTKLSYSVVVTNPPPLKTPSERKAFIESACGESLDASKVELRPGKNGWRVAIAQKATAEKLALGINNQNQGSSAKIRTPSHIGIVKGIPESLSAEDLQRLIAGCEKVEQCGKSRTFKLYFSSRDAFDTAAQMTIKIDFERFKIQEFIFLPKRCFNCHEIGHMSTQCKNTKKCGRCAQNYHGATKESPCQNPICCLNCQSTKHTCYHANCPLNKTLKPKSQSVRNG